MSDYCGSNNYLRSKTIVQEQDTDNTTAFTDYRSVPASGRLIAIDPGTKRIGVAVSDEMRVTCRPLCVLTRTNWKKLLRDIEIIIADYDAVALVIGLPLETDGSESEMSVVARDIARKFSLSLHVPVLLQDERVTSYEASGRLWSTGMSPKKASQLVDAEAAAIILRDAIGQINGITVD